MRFSGPWIIRACMNASVETAGCALTVPFVYFVAVTCDSARISRFTSAS